MLQVDNKLQWTVIFIGFVVVLFIVIKRLLKDFAKSDMLVISMVILAVMIVVLQRFMKDKY